MHMSRWNIVIGQVKVKATDMTYFARNKFSRSIAPKKV